VQIVRFGGRLSGAADFGVNIGSRLPAHSRRFRGCDQVCGIEGPQEIGNCCVQARRDCGRVIQSERNMLHYRGRKTLIVLWL